MKTLYLSCLVLLLLSVSTVGAEEKFNFGEQWTKAPIPEKTQYMEGYQAGYTMGVMNATKQFMPTATEADKEKAFKMASMIFADRRLGKDMLIDVIITMDHLYKDPANGYIDKASCWNWPLTRSGAGTLPMICSSSAKLPKMNPNKSRPPSLPTAGAASSKLPTVG